MSAAIFPSDDEEAVTRWRMCRLCGAMVGVPGKQAHEAWHRAHGDLGPQDTPRRARVTPHSGHT